MAFPVAQSRQLVRTLPFGSQQVVTQSVLNDGVTITKSFEISQSVSDRNQLKAGVIADTVPAVGPILDVSVLSTGIGTLDILMLIDIGGAPASILPAPLAVAANLMLQVVGLRIAARYVVVRFTNTSGGNATVDFGAFMRSN